MTSPIICLMGPTASGKSAVAMALAEKFSCEIVSVDSAQVYRGMDIGTAKPSASDRARVPHHLIDLIDPAERYSAARFCTDARAAIADIRSRGKLPLLVGGTMLYFKALRDGLDDMPSRDAEVRKAIEAEAAKGGWPALHARLAAVDPASSARLAPNDAQRIARALEVWRVSGQRLSALQKGGAKDSDDREFRFVNIALEPSDRAVLHAHIATRFDAMLAAGLVDEVRALHARGDLDIDQPAMRCVGYRQIWNYLEGRIDHSAMRTEAIAATRQLAKRQLTWLRALPDRHQVDSLGDSLTAVSAIVSREIGAPQS